ncbi:MAG: hypothetical protein HYX84_08465 [Chloroflexi bacterium]|nr:hypothetical protein [Chloroflexota bacterium]
MTNKLKLYIGLLLLGVSMVGGGAWGLLKLPPQIDVPEGDPIIGIELDFVIRGEFAKLFLYDSGAVLYIEEKNLRMSMPEAPPTRVWKTGKIDAGELSNLIELFQTAEFAALDAYYQFPGKPIEPIEGVPAGGFTIGDGKFTFSIDHEDVKRTVTAFGYLTPDKGLTYPDMPYPLNEIYKGLKGIAENRTEEVYSEPIRP